MSIKEIARQVGWAGWVVVGLIILLIVGAIVAANTTGPVTEVSTSDDKVIDASNDVIGDTSLPGGEIEDEPERVEDPIVVEDEPETDVPEAMPQTGGGDNGEEFEYYYNWD